MNTQNSSDANKSAPDYEKKREGAPAAPGKSEKHDSHEQGRSRDERQTEGKDRSNKGEQSTGVR